MPKKAAGKDKPTKKKKESLWSRVFENDDFVDDEDFDDEALEDEDLDDEDEAPKKKSGKGKKEAASDKKTKTKKKTKQPVEKIDLFDDDDDDADEETTVAVDKLLSEDDDDYDVTEEDIQIAASLTWDDGESLVDEELIKSGAATVEKRKAAQAKKTENAADPAVDDGAPINLFDDDAEKRETRTTLLRTSTGGTTRVHINATETIRNVENAKKQQREREAQRQHEEFLERQQKKKKRKQSMRQMVANTFFAIALTIAAIAAAYYVFLLGEVTVYGNQTYSADYIVQLSGLQLGKHMLACDLTQAKANIQEDPYLQVDDITYGFPNRIAIRITERQEVAGIIGLDYNVIIDRNGYVLSMSGGTDLSGLLQVSGVSMSGFQLGQRLGEGGDFGTATLIEMIAKLEQYGMLKNIKSIDLTTPLATTMIATNGLKIHVGQPVDLDSKMASLALLLPRFLTQNITSGTLYLSAKGGTVYSPSNAAENALNALNGQQPQDTTPDPNATPDPDIPLDPNVTPDPNSTPDPNVTPTPTPTPKPTPTPYGGGDEFQG